MKSLIIFLYVISGILPINCREEKTKKTDPAAIEKVEELQSQGKHEECIGTATLLIDNGAEEYELFYNRGLSKQKIGYLDQAAKDFDLMIKYVPDSLEWFAYLTRAKYRWKANQIKDMQSDINEAITLHPELAKQIYNRKFMEE